MLKRFLKQNIHLIALLFLAIAGSSCKTHPEAFKLAHQTLRDKSEEKQLEQRSQTATTMSSTIEQQLNDTTRVQPAEEWTVILGKASNLNQYNVVAGSFINRTNARSFYARMQEDEGYPAVLIQNESLMYRIIVASYSDRDQALNSLSILRRQLPDAVIILQNSK